MPPKPSSAARCKVSTGNVSFSSHSRANGIISSRANARAVSWMARCSSVRSKSIVRPIVAAHPAVNTPLKPPAFGNARLSEHPGLGIRNWPVLVEREDALDIPDQRPDEPPEKHKEADQDHGQDRADND